MRYPVRISKWVEFEFDADDYLNKEPDDATMFFSPSSVYFAVNDDVEKSTHRQCLKIKIVKRNTAHAVLRIADTVTDADCIFKRNIVIDMVTDVCYQLLETRTQRMVLVFVFVLRYLLQIN